jgi:coenzyme PQQ biosynthesis protein PqqD
MTDKPCLASKVRLRWDGYSAKTLLLAPERGLILDDTATVIALMCDGTRTVDDIAAELASQHDGDISLIRIDVAQFVGALAIRGLLAVER